MFTAGLEARGLAAAEVAGLRPMEQVMGACVLGTPSYGSARPVGVARRRAVQRMQHAAGTVEADAVAGVQVTHTERQAGLSERDSLVVEAVATGMAVALPGPPAPPGDPVLTNLTIQEIWKLVRGGYAPAGIVMSTIADAASLTGMPGSGGQSVAGTNYEFADVSAMFQVAYRCAAQDMRKEAAALGAEGVIAVEIDRRTRWAGLYVRLIMTVIGTAIVSVRDDPEAGPRSGSPRLRITPVRHANDPSSPGTRPSAFS